MPQSIANKILKRINNHGRGWIFSTKDFFDLGDRYAVNMALHRLKNKGRIRQILRGIYDYPAFSRILNALATPNPYHIIETIARTYGWTICPSGNTALNLLGLSTQVPAKYIFYTDGPSKKYNWNGAQFEFLHRAIKETSGLSPRTALAVQALKALGRENTTEKVIARLRKEFSEKELRNAIRETQVATNWIYAALKRATEKDR
jgi:hypothetical protein